MTQLHLPSSSGRLVECLRDVVVFCNATVRHTKSNANGALRKGTSRHAPVGELGPTGGIGVYGKKKDEEKR